MFNLEIFKAMKKIFVILQFALLAISAGAQTMEDALTFGENRYYGTARTIGMGNAVTAVGGDLGSININPAGSAVAGYSQFTVSPGFAISGTPAYYSPSYNYNDGPSYGGSVSETAPRFNLPNLGLTLRFETGNRVGLKSYTFGIVSNQTNNYVNKVVAHGQSYGSSMTTAMAVNATNNGLPGDVLYRYSSPYNSGYYWNDVAAYWGGLINYNADTDEFYGSAEAISTDAQGNVSYVSTGTLNQGITQTILGSKNDFVMNLGLNYNDKLFIGFNLGIPVFNYKYSSLYKETPTDTYDFPTTVAYIGSKTGEYVTEDTEYAGSSYLYEYTSRGTGIYAKVGAIWLPTPGLRLAAAIQSPTYYTVSDKWNIGVNTYYTTAEEGYSDSPIGEGYYSYTAPYSFNLGAAYTFGAAGMLSVDYELTDYSIMKFSSAEYDTYADDSYYQVNRLNKLFCGVSHQLRIGAEYRPMPFLALRAGYNITTSPERYYEGVDSDVYAADYDYNFNAYENGSLSLGNKKSVNNPVRALSLGFGVSSTGAFYADFAIRRTAYSSMYYSPYSSYMDDYSSPLVKYDRRVWDVVATFGWRF